MTEQDLQLTLFGWYDANVQPDTWKWRTLEKAYLLHLIGGLTPEVIARFRAEHDRITAEKAAQKNTFRDN